MVLRLLIHPHPFSCSSPFILSHSLYRRLPDGIRVFKSPHSVTIPVLSRPTTNILDSLRFTPETTMSQIKQAIGSSKSTRNNSATKTSTAATTRSGGKSNKTKGAAGRGGGSGTPSQTRSTPGVVPGAEPAPGVNKVKDRKPQPQPQPQSQPK